MTPARVMITGNAGSGKTAFARDLGLSLGISVVCLDEIVWQAGWRKTPSDEKRAAIADLVQRPVWIVDGVSDSVEEVADLVVFLDVPPSLCTLRCAKRNWRYLFRSRPGLPRGCPEWRIIPSLLKIILRFNRRVRPGIVGRMQRSPQRYRHVITRHHRNEVYRELASTFS